MLVAVPTTLYGAHEDRSPSHIGKTTPAVGWKTAIELPGFSKLGTRGRVEALSCSTAGNCSVGGYYLNKWRTPEAFVASEVDGHWHPALEVRHTYSPPFNSSSGAQVSAISCRTPGNCVASGFFEPQRSNQDAFVVREVAGIWQPAGPIPGLGLKRWRQYSSAAVEYISCPSVTSCVATGQYTPSRGSYVEEGFVATENEGVWTTPMQLPGTQSLDAQGSDGGPVVCTSTGNCVATGVIATPLTHFTAYVVNERQGSWNHIIKDVGQYSRAASYQALACPSSGNCVAGGFSSPARNYSRAVIVNEVSGRWGQVMLAPGVATLSKGHYAMVTSIACVRAGECTAVGTYTDGKSGPQTFGLIEDRGRWGTAVELPGTAALNKGAIGYGAWVNAPEVTCDTTNYCVAVGSTLTFNRYEGGFVAIEVNGTWQSATKVPGTLAQHANMTEVSCPSALRCTAVGDGVTSRVEVPIVSSQI